MRIPPLGRLVMPNACLPGHRSLPGRAVAWIVVSPKDPGNRSRTGQAQGVYVPQMGSEHEQDPLRVCERVSTLNPDRVFTAPGSTSSSFDIRIILSSLPSLLDAISVAATLSHDVSSPFIIPARGALHYTLFFLCVVLALQHRRQCFPAARFRQIRPSWPWSEPSIIGIFYYRCQSDSRNRRAGERSNLGYSEQDLGVPEDLCYLDAASDR